MKKQIFKVGDRVYDFNFRWGTVVSIEELSVYAVEVKFDNYIDNLSYTIDGKFIYKDHAPRLSFTKYDLVNGGFSQERPINYEEYVGKWGKFWDTVYENTVVIAKLSSYRIENDENHHYRSFRCFTVGEYEETSYTNFEPLTEEQIKVLRL